MPWCDDCDRFLSPNTVRADGSCPTCGSHIASPAKMRRAREGRGASADALVVRSEQAATEPLADTGSGEQTNDQPSTPWHFKLLLVALILYLTWRLVQGIGWVAHHL